MKAKKIRLPKKNPKNKAPLANSSSILLAQTSFSSRLLGVKSSEAKKSSRLYVNLHSWFSAMEDKSSEKKLIKDHLSELSFRLYLWLAAFMVASTIGYLNSEKILSWLILPLNKPLYYTSPIGGFEAIFSTSLIFGFLISLPVLVYQIIKYVEPAFEDLRGKHLLYYALASLFLAALGICVSYYLIFPASLNFLNTFGSDQLQSLISTREYFSLVTKYLVGFAILFQLPLVIYLLSLITPITPKILLNKFKYVFALSFLIAAILTPTPDFFNQTIMATPIILLYLLTILILVIKKVIVK